MSSPQKQMNLVRILTLAAMALMVLAYFSPIWWVSLTAPNYPKDAFPDGIRIHFHFNGVFNGCKTVPAKAGRQAELMQYDLGDDLAARENPVLAGKTETQVGLDCVHEMNTINHYVGMYPIETGAPVERPLSKFFIAFFAIMMLGFMCFERKRQLLILAGGFAALSAWILVDQYAMGGLNAFAAHYREVAGTFFNQPEILVRWESALRTVTHAVIVGLIAVMVFIVGAVWKFPKFTLVLALVPALLPVFFVLDYAGWLWFFGHNLHPWGAFTVKPFMPTVFGEGKVAQFSTFSYPYYGYAMLCSTGVAMALALLIRRKLMREQAS